MWSINDTFWMKQCCDNTERFTFFYTYGLLNLTPPGLRISRFHQQWKVSKYGSELLKAAWPTE